MYASVTNWMRTFAASEEGVTAIEYGLIAALIAVVIIGSIVFVGGEVGTIFNTWSTAVDNAIKGSQT